MKKALHTAVIIPYEKIGSHVHLFSNKKTVLVGGCFDILHFGHLTFLQKARRRGEALIVALESDEFMKKKKKRTPIHSQNERAHILASLRQVDFVITLPFFSHDNDYLELVKKIKPSVIAVTSRDPQDAKKRSHAASGGARFAVVTPTVGHFSSSQITL